MMRFDIKVDDKGTVLIPKVAMASVKGKKLVMVLDQGEIRIMPKTKFKVLTAA